MYLINIHEDFMTSLGTSNFLKKHLNVQYLTNCNKNLDCFNNLAFFYYLNIFFNKEIFKIAELSL